MSSLPRARLSLTRKHSPAHARPRAQPEGQADNTDIITEWGKKISPESVKTIFEYPRPQMVRSSFTNLSEYTSNPPVA